MAQASTSSTTMKDVAKKAEVSLKTVSRVVNGDPRVNPQLADRVRCAISELGYRRNLAAASIRPGWTSKMIGLIISDLANPYYSILARAVEDVVTAHGYMLVVASSEESGPVHDQILDRFMEQRMDGVIIVPPRIPGRNWTDVPPPLPPIVFLDRPGTLPGADCVLADNAGGSRAATAYLLARGARHVAFVGDSLQIYTMSERYKGFSEALEAAGAAPEDLLVVSSAHSKDDARREVTTLLKSNAVDAIFAANNRAVFGALEAFALTGTHVPLVGFDYFEAAHLINGGVPVVSQDIEKMGQTAAKMLLGRIGGDTSGARTQVLLTTLVS